MDTWGSVSDWIMVCVTALTAYYLYKTLKSQQDVQRTQNELFRIESIRFKESIKPVLKYSYNTHMKAGDEKITILTIEVTNETNSAALKISRFVAENEQQIFIPMGFPDKRDHLTKGDSPLLFHFSVDSRSLRFVTFLMKYRDVADNKYQQRVICLCDKHGIEIHPSLPEGINSENVI